MKKLFATILAFVYLSTSMGATIHFHYCMGRFISWSLSDKESKACANCGMQKNTQNPSSLSAKSNCCQDAVHQVKTDKDQKATQTDLQFSKIFAEAYAVHKQALSNNLFSSLAVAFPNSNAPPFESKNPIFILNRNFRI
jgi:hypothetical protein